VRLGDQLSLGLAADAAASPREVLGEGAVLLRRFVVEYGDAMLDEIDRVAGRAPFRHMITPGGFTMSAAMTNCGALGWTSDASGYRYTRIDPASGAPWPSMPALFADVARDAAAAAGFTRFEPDACLVNRYVPGARMTLHQDKNERDFDAPIVSVSLGIDAVFLFGGQKRREPVRRERLLHGDVVVWGGPSRLRYHGVAPLAHDTHPRAGAARFNLTFRKAG
jgi:alkylated DNA repair protein (DNA oxidative demethylase)